MEKIIKESEKSLIEIIFNYSIIIYFPLDEKILLATVSIQSIKLLEII